MWICLLCTYLLRCFEFLMTCHHLLVQYSLNFVEWSWKHSRRHSPTSHFLHLTWTLSFIPCVEQLWIQSGGWKWPVTAKVYFKLYNLFLCNTGPAHGLMWVRQTPGPFLSSSAHGKVGSLSGSFQSHIQSKEGSCLELSCVRSKKIF
jgi:hypothetical protein